MPPPEKKRSRDERTLVLTALPRDILDHAVKFVALHEVPAVAALSKTLAQAAAGDVLWESLAAIAFPHLAVMRAGMRAPPLWRTLVKQQFFARGKQRGGRERNTAASNLLLTVRIGHEVAFNAPLHKAGFAVWRDKDMLGIAALNERESFYRPAIVFPVPAELHAAAMAGASGGSETIALEVMVCQQDTGGIGICTAKRCGSSIGAEYEKKGKLFQSGGGGAFWNLDHKHVFWTQGDMDAQTFFPNDRHEGPDEIDEGDSTFLNAVLLPPSKADQIAAAITPDLSEPLVSRQGSLGTLGGTAGGAVLALLSDEVEVEEGMGTQYWHRAADLNRDPAKNYRQARDKLFDQVHAWVLSMPVTRADGRKEEFGSEDCTPKPRKKRKAKTHAVMASFDAACQAAGSDVEHGIADDSDDGE